MCIHTEWIHIMWCAFLCVLQTQIYISVSIHISVYMYVCIFILTPLYLYLKLFYLVMQIFFFYSSRLTVLFSFVWISGLSYLCLVRKRTLLIVLTIALNININLRRIDIFVVLRLPICKDGLSFHLLIIFQLSFIVSSSQMILHFFVRNTLGKTYFLSKGMFYNWYYYKVSNYCSWY